MQHPIDMTVLADVLAALAAALVISFAVTPAVKILAQRVGAIDVPKDNRRMHDHPIPLLGGLAVFIGFIISVLISAPSETATLINALRPYLKADRLAKVDKALSIAKLAKAAKVILPELGGGKNV